MSILEIENESAHFGAVEILPKILAWVAETARNSSLVTAASAAELAEARHAKYQFVPNPGRARGAR